MTLLTTLRADREAPRAGAAWHFFRRPAWPSRLRGRVPRSTLALLAISIVLPMALFGLAAWQNWRDVELGAEHHVERTTRILHEHALKIFETHQLMLDQVNEHLRTLDWSNPRDVAALHALLAHLQKLLPQVVDILVIDEHGALRTHSLDHTGPETTFADRDYFIHLRAADQDSPYISKVVIGRQTGVRIFNMAVRIQAPDSSAFHGVVVVSIDQDYFGDFYRFTERSPNKTVLLARDDGSVLASEPPTDMSMLPPEVLAQLKREGRSSSTLIRPTLLDGKQQMMGYQKVGSYPVVVGFGISHATALAPWWRNMQGYGLVAGLSSLALFGVSGFAIRRIVLEGRATVSWRRSAALLEEEMRKRERIEEQLRQSQKMEAVGQLTGGIAHDFNNLLTVVIGNLDLLGRRLPDAEPAHRALIRNAVDGANRAATLTSRLLAFSRRQPLSPEALDANALVGGMTNLLSRTLGETVTINLKLADRLWTTFADPNQLENAILNLCVNAVDAMPRGGVLTISTGNAELDEVKEGDEALAGGDFVAITVGDTGTGMPPEVMERAFEPFFTTKPVGKGTGLGLSQLYGFARQSGGRATIASRQGEGTSVSLYLPRVAARLAPDRPAEPAEPVRAQALGTTVLIVEDDEAVRRLGSCTLRDAGYEVIEAATGVEALHLLQLRPLVALLFTDVVLKGTLNGRELAERARMLRPGLPVLFTTGYASDAAPGRLDDGSEVIDKPFTAGALTARVAALIAAAAPAELPSAVA